MRARAFVAVALLMIVLAGCGGDPEPTDSPTTDSTPTVASTTSEAAEEEPTKATASVQQYASKIAPLKAKWSDIVADFDGCFGEEDSPLCGGTALIADLAAETAGLTIQASQDPDAPGFIGVAPDEIEDLLDDTYAAAAEVQLRYDDYDEGGCPNVDGCIALSTQLFFAIGKLQDAYESWEPYL